MFRKMTFLVIVFFSLVCTEAMAADVVGTVIATQGQVYAISETGAKRLLQRRSDFYLQEVIMTEKNSSAQLKLKDETIISLKSNTRYSVNEFNLDANNPKNNRYVGKLVEGVLVSLSGQGKNSTHNNHVLKTPVVTIAIRGTLFEGGFKTKKHSQKSQGVINKALGIGWVSVEDGAVAVKGGGREFGINALDSSNNACFIVAAGNLDKKGQFKVSPKVEVSVTPMSDAKMRGLVNTVINTSSNSGIITTVSANSSGEGSGSVGGVDKIVIVPATPSTDSGISAAQQGVASTVSAVSSSTLPPVIVPEPLPIPPESPGRPTGNGE